jgi:glycosyltransferase involved in cell wall biosynthesis
MIKKPKVSILCITYNQKDYIKQCIDSFLMQKTDFDFEILINDDASNDGTSEILKEYRAKYPDKIILNLQQENQYSKGIRNMMVRFLLPRAKGKYIAICEGDDYWTDKTKLQKQVDFLDSNPDYSVCFHPVRVFFENKEKEDYIFPRDMTDGFTFESLLGANFIQTNSVMYRKQDYKGMAVDVIPGDWYLHIYHAKFGKIGFINQVMSDYRRHPGGIWWGAIGDQTNFWKKNGIMHLMLYKRLLDMFGDNEKYKNIIMKNAGRNTNSIIAADDSSDEELIHKIADNFPGFVRQSVLNSSSEINELKKLVASKEKEISVIENEKDSSCKELKDLKTDKLKILNSWNYKVGSTILFIPKSIIKYVRNLRK